ncbi:MAG: hypothetical protein CMJ85_02905, partial [Planctomycetes bacterium]|nr:hypothetical protein [Planctomycetota bacterium]
MRLAETYVGLADKALLKEPPAHKEAISFLDLAIGLELPESKAHEFGLRAARLAFKAKDWRNAANRFQGLVKKVRGGVFGQRRGPAAFEDRLWLARAWRRAKKVAQARRLLEDLLREGIDGDRRPIAVFELALSHGKNARAVDVLRRFLNDHSEHESAPEVAYRLAKTQASLGRLTDALATLDMLLSRYADRPVDHLAQAAADRGDYLARLQRFDEASAAWRSYLARFPAHGRWMDAQRAIVDLDLAQADNLRKQGKERYDEAGKLYAAFLVEHPLDGRARTIHLTLARMDQARDKFEAAEKVYRRAVNKFPRTREASEAQFRIGYLRETKLFDYPAALEAYKEVTGPFARQAQQRLAVLRKKSLAVVTERVFRTDEKPTIKVRSRNIEKLRLRVYKLSLETFFRGTLGRGNVDALAVEVISPDKSFESRVDSYVPYKETERAVELPFGGAGAFVVKTDDGELEATTLVLVSDLALISKASRGELFVFAQNTRQNVAQPGAKVFLTDGSKVLAEGKTDERGSFRFRGKALGSAKSLYVYAQTGDGSAATTLNVSGLRISAGLQSKSFLYTDRAAYRPGETVSARAIVRDVSKGAYAIPDQKDYRIDWLDGHGRLLRSQAVTTSVFGTLSTSFDVPEQAQPGRFSLRLVRKRDEHVLTTGTVQVATFQMPRLSLTVDAERKVLVRGEKIEGRVRAQWFFGGPVSGKRVEVTATLGGSPRVVAGKTNDAGELPFSFETAALASSTVVRVSVSMPSEQAHVEERFLLRDTEFNLALELPSTVYLAGDDLEAAVRLRTWDDKPSARDVEVGLYRLVQEKGAVQEVPVRVLKVATDAKNGRGFARFQVADGGKHRLRVWAIDRLGNRIDARRDFYVSGKDDDVKLRVLSSVQHGKVGDTVVLRVVNRVGPKLCLVTTEGDGVLAFSTRVFGTGETRVELPLTETHAPNFAWAVSIAGEKKLFQARKEFIVGRPLVVTVTPRADRLQPGGKLALNIVAKDSHGRPVEAEFSVALVDQAILDVWPDMSPDLYTVFYGPGIRRSTDMRTASSCSFRHAAVTHRVNTELKRDEVQRMREEKRDKERQTWGESVDDGLVLLGEARKKMRGPGDSIAKFDNMNAIGLGGGAGGRFGRRPQARGPSSPAPVGQSGDMSGYVQSGGKPLAAWSYRGGAFNLANPNNDAGGEGGAGERPRPLASDRAVWHAAIATGSDGKVTVEIELPPRDGRWAIRARGVSRGTLVGEAKTSVVTAKELLVRPALPTVLTEGDRARPRLRVHNLTDKDAKVSWHIESGGKTVDGEASVESQGSIENDFPLATGEAGDQKILLSAKSEAGAVDSVLSEITVLPWAIEERTARSGVLSGDATIKLSLPEGEYRSRELVVELGPDIAEELLPLDSIRRTQLSCGGADWVAPTHANRAASGLAALALHAHWAASSHDSGALARLRARIETTIAAVQSLESGGEIRWIGKRGTGSADARSSLLGFLFLVRARGRGFAVDDGVLQRFRGKIANLTRNRDRDIATSAMLCSAEDKKADFGRFNSLYRARRDLRLGAKGRLALAAIAMDRRGLAKDLVADLAAKVAPLVRAGQVESEVLLRVRESNVEQTLWALLALQAAGGHGHLLEQAARWLWSKRRPWGWSNANVTALAVELLAKRKRSADRVANKVDVLVNGRFTKSVDFTKDRTHRRILIPGDAVQAGANSITLRTSGRGSVVWSALLTGLTKDLPEKRIGSRYLRRTYEQPARLLDGQALPFGFRTVDKLEQWKNEATQVQVGGRVHAELTWSPRAQLHDKVGSFVLEEPLPAGTLVLPSEVSGNHDHVEVGPGFLRFFVHRKRGWLHVRYTLRGVVAGEYGVLPPRVFSLEDPAVVVYGSPSKIKVLGPDGEITDQRRSTPDELHAEAVRRFDALSREELAAGSPARDVAERALSSLWTKFGRHLKSVPFRETARRLLRISLARQTHARTVELFEELKDRDENWVLSFDDMAKVGLAYFSTGEFERALIVYQAICETSFLREVQIAGTLDRHGEIRSAVDFMKGLFWTFPDVPTVRGAMYSLAQSLGRKATELEGSGKADPKAGRPAELKRKARDLCYEFLLRYPEDADAAEVTFTLASIALEAEQLSEAIELLQRARKAHTGSTWLDEFVYLEGYARFLEGEPEQALALLERVAKNEFPLGNGRTGTSDSKWLALFLTGQIHHAAGRPKQALAEYSKVEKRFADASEAADYFRDRRLALREVTLAKPSEAATVELKLRNIEHIDITVYKVDLMRLYLMRKSLRDMGEVQLFGIAPVHERRITTTTGRDFVDHELKVKLPVQEVGAYLVLARAGELKSSGLLLRSDLRIEAQELADEGRIRVNVRKGEGYVAKAEVKVVGERDGRIRTGKTDQRGIYVADELQGRATVLVRVGDAYAFHRGKVYFGGMPQPQTAETKARPAQKSKGLLRFKALRMNDIQNFQLQQQRDKLLKQLYRNRQQG